MYLVYYITENHRILTRTKKNSDFFCETEYSEVVRNRRIFLIFFSREIEIEYCQTVQIIFTTFSV